MWNDCTEQFQLYRCPILPATFLETSDFLLTLVPVILDQIPSNSSDISDITLPRTVLMKVLIALSSSLQWLAIGFRTMNIFSFIMMVSAAFVAAVLLYFAIFLYGFPHFC